MKRVLLLAAISSMLSLGFVACGESEETTASPPNEPATTPESSEAPIPEVTEEVPREPTEPAEAEEPPREEETAEPVESQADLDCEAEDIECPTFDWMEANARPAVEDRDLPALAKVLRKIEFLAPEESWNEGENGWAPMSRRGAIAAENGDLRGARAACKGCHKLYPEDQSFRDRFQERYRLQAMPELPENAEEGRPDIPDPDGA